MARRNPSLIAGGAIVALLALVAALGPLLARADPLAMEALGKLDASTAWCIGQINGCAATATSLDPAVARKIWGEPRGALSWGPPVKSRAEEVDGGHRVSGEWMMSSGSRHVTWIGLMALPVDRGGALALPFSTAGMYRGFVREGGAIHTAIYDEPYRSE